MPFSPDPTAPVPGMPFRAAATRGLGPAAARRPRESCA